MQYEPPVTRRDESVRFSPISLDSVLGMTLVACAPRDVRVNCRNSVVHVSILSN